MLRRTPTAATAHATLADALPELWWDGTWLVLSNRLPQPGRAPAYLHVLIDIRAGTCPATAIDNAPLGARVGNWLDAAVKERHRPVRVFTDNPQTINLGTLAS
ncbi:hypothetical protein [Cupriavidus lacunae]|uniref:Uncharacterized protein n=1 Tax=Cupriavidus lacunae TaxID=2666307 RepID=A0A370NLH9_9BURK|nr:hypothetical protein [Cupriavidus lacunae]RDK06456.1 hypothetical protein DN412_31195 [Cupriavidus lacunae]